MQPLNGAGHVPLGDGVAKTDGLSRVVGAVERGRKGNKIGRLQTRVAIPRTGHGEGEVGLIADGPTRNEHIILLVGHYRQRQGQRRRPARTFHGSEERAVVAGENDDIGRRQARSHRDGHNITVGHKREPHLIGRGAGLVAYGAVAESRVGRGRGGIYVGHIEGIRDRCGVGASRRCAKWEWDSAAAFVVGRLSQS